MYIGDVIRVDLDLDSGTLSFSRNGVNLGVAFDDFVMDEPENFFPGFSFFDPGDKITILSGSMPVAKVDNVVSNSDKFARGDIDNRLLRTESGSLALDSSVASEQNLDKLERLIQLGFPRSACVQALHNYEFNMPLATEFLMNNAEKFRSEERDRQMRKERLQAEQKAHQTASWIVQTMLDMEAAMKQTAADSAKARAAASAATKLSREQSKAAEATAAVIRTSSSGYIGDRRNVLTTVEDDDDDDDDAGADSSSYEDSATEDFDLVDPSKADAPSGSNSEDDDDFSDTAEFDVGTEDGDSGSEGGEFDDESSSLDDDEFERYWGFKLLVVPMELSGSAMVGVVAKDQKRLVKLRLLAAKWTLAADEQLVEFFCEWARNTGVDPLNVVPSDVKQTDIKACGPRFAKLAAFPQREIQLRVLFLQAFNRRVRQLLPLIDLSCDSDDSTLAANVRVLRGLIFSPVKESIWQTTLRLSESDVAQRPTVLVDRMGALGALSTANASPLTSRPQSPSAALSVNTSLGSTGATRSNSDPVFLQLFEQLHDVDPARMRHGERGYIVKMLGEHADDSGGPYREALDVACAELQSSRLPIFIPCPNQRDDVGATCRDAWMPNPNAAALLSQDHGAALATSPALSPNSKTRSDSADAPAVQQTQSTSILDYLEFLGKLMGIALRTGCHSSGLVLRFPQIVWKYLVQSEVTFADVCEYDKIVGDRVTYIETIAHEIMETDYDEDERASAWLEETEDLDLRHCVMGADGVEHELFPGGKEMIVQWGAHQEYLEATKNYRIREVQLQCEAIAHGIATQIPRSMLSLFTPKELERMVCGESTIDVGFLREITEYVEPMVEQDEVVEYFWEVLNGFSQDELGRYLRFIWGRSRLPARTDASSKPLVHKICFMDTEERADPDAFMPVGHTCFLRLDLPNYSSAAVLRRQLLYAITHTQCIDADEGTTAEQQALAAYAQ